MSEPFGNAESLTDAGSPLDGAVGRLANEGTNTDGATEALAQACNELSAALGWPRGISVGPLPWDELLRIVARRTRQAPNVCLEPPPEAVGSKAGLGGVFGDER